MLSKPIFPSESKRKIWGKVCFWKTYFFCFRTLDESFSADCRIVFANVVKTNFSVGAQKQDLRKVFFEKPTFFRFRTLNEKFSACCQIFSGKIVKTAIYESIATFWAKLINWKETFVFLIFGNCAKFFRPPGKSYRRGHVNSFLRRRPK